MSRLWFGDEPASGWVHVPTTTGVVDLLEMVAVAEELWIDDALAFPWDTAGTAISVPTTVNVGTGLLDMAALAPCLHTLGDGDCITSPDSALERHLAAHFGTASGRSPRSLAARTRAESIDRSRTDNVDRLTREAAERGEADRVHLKHLSVDDIVDRPGDEAFVDTANRLCAPLGPGQVTEVWGLREAPGMPVAGAIVAYRLDDAVGDAP